MEKRANNTAMQDARLKGKMPMQTSVLPQSNAYMPKMKPNKSQSPGQQMAYVSSKKYAGEGEAYPVMSTTFNRSMMGQSRYGMQNPNEQAQGHVVAKKLKKAQGVFTNYGGAWSNSASGASKSSSQGSKGSNASKGSKTLQTKKVKTAQKVSLKSDKQRKEQQPTIPQANDYGYVEKHQNNFQLQSNFKIKSGVAQHTQPTQQYQSYHNVNYAGDQHRGGAAQNQQVHKQGKKIQIMRSIEYNSMNPSLNTFKQSPPTLPFPNKQIRNNSQQQQQDDPQFLDSNISFRAISPRAVHPKSKHNSEEPRYSAGMMGGTASGTAVRRMVEFDAETEKEIRMRLKKKMLMSDSLNMLTKQRNQYLNQSINNSNNSSKNRKPKQETVNNYQDGFKSFEETNSAKKSKHRQFEEQDGALGHSEVSATGTFNQQQQINVKKLPNVFKNTLNSVHSTSQSNLSKSNSIRFTDGPQEDILLPQQIHEQLGTKPSQTIESDLFSRIQQSSGYDAPNSSRMYDNSNKTTIRNNTRNTNTTVNSASLLKREPNQSQTKTAVAGQQVKQMRISQNFIEKFKERQQNETMSKTKSTEKVKKINEIIDKQKFAEKLEKLQRDIELRNQIQDQREMELNRLQKDLHDQIIEISNSQNNQNSVNSASSRELTFQLRQLREFEKIAANESMSGVVGAGGAQATALNPFRLNLRLNSQRGSQKPQAGQTSSRFTPNLILQNDTQNISNLNTDRVTKDNHFKAGTGDDRSYIMNQNLVMSQHSGVNSARSGGMNGTGNSAQNSGRQRSQKRGNKNVNQKEVRQRQDPARKGTGLAAGNGLTPPSGGPDYPPNNQDQRQTGDPNYGVKVHLCSQEQTMANKLSPPKPASHFQDLPQTEKKAAKLNIKPLNLKHQPNEVQQRVFNFHSQLSSSRHSVSNTVTVGMMSDTKQKPLKSPRASTGQLSNEGNDRINYSGSSMIHSQSLLTSSRDIDLQAELGTKQQRAKVFGGGKQTANHQEGIVQIINKNIQILGSQGFAEKFGSGSKKGLNERSISNNKEGNKLNDQIYMTVGQIAGAQPNLRSSKENPNINPINSMETNKKMFRTVSQTSTDSNLKLRSKSNKKTQEQQSQNKIFTQILSQKAQLSLEREREKNESRSGNSGRPLKKLHKNFLVIQQVGHNGKQSLYSLQNQKPNIQNQAVQPQAGEDDEYQIMGSTINQAEALENLKKGKETQDGRARQNQYRSRNGSPRAGLAQTFTGSDGAHGGLAQSAQDTRPPAALRRQIPISRNNGLNQNTYQPGTAQTNDGGSYIDVGKRNNSAHNPDSNAANASQLFDNSLLCCLTQAKKPKPVSRRAGAPAAKGYLNAQQPINGQQMHTIADSSYQNKILKAPFINNATISKRSQSEQQKNRVLTVGNQSLVAASQLAQADNKSSNSGQNNQQQKCLVQ